MTFFDFPPCLFQRSAEGASLPDFPIGCRQGFRNRVGKIDDGECATDFSIVFLTVKVGYAYPFTFQDLDSVAAKYPFDTFTIEKRTQLFVLGWRSNVPASNPTDHESDGKKGKKENAPTMLDISFEHLVCEDSNQEAGNRKEGRNKDELHGRV
jgi:hypothetical protein